MCVASLVSKDILPPKFQFHANQTHVHCCLRSSRKSQRQRVVWFSTVQFSLMRVYVWMDIRWYFIHSPSTLQRSSKATTFQHSSIHPSNVLCTRWYSITQQCVAYSIIILTLTLTHVQYIAASLLFFIVSNQTIELSVAEYYRRTKAKREKIIYLFLLTADSVMKLSQVKYNRIPNLMQLTRKIAICWGFLKQNSIV